MTGAQHLMVDLETLGSSPRAVILSIGAVFFDTRGDPAATAQLTPASSLVFYRVVDAASQPDRVIDAHAVAWWMAQSEEARSEVFPPYAGFNKPAAHVVALQRAMTDFNRFALGVVDSWELRLWCQGFDAAILEDVYRRAGVDTPWRYWNIRDTRTAYELAGDTQRKPSGDTAHVAWQDCVAQAQRVQRAAAALAVAR